MSKKREKQPEEQKFVGRRYRVQFDIGYVPKQGSEVDSESQTVPNMSLTVQQLLQNYTRGQESGDLKSSEPLYFDTEVPQITDITDVHAYKKHLQEKLKQTQEFIDKEVKDAEEKRKQEAAEKRSTGTGQTGQRDDSGNKSQSNLSKQADH